MNKTTNMPLDSVNHFERTYRLPHLTGTKRQVTWARVLREEILTPIFEELLDSTAALQPEERAAVYRLLDQWRAETRATAWIDRRDIRGHATFVLLKCSTSKGIDDWLD